MLNFPILGGSSGHLVGAVLAAVLLGPGAAVLVIACVLILQCFMFADGGVTALGANVFNMALVGAGGGYAVYLPVRRLAPAGRGRIVATAFAAWCSTVAASIACAGELALSGAAARISCSPRWRHPHADRDRRSRDHHPRRRRGGPIAARTRRSKLRRSRLAWRVPRVRLPGCLALLVFVAPFASPLPDGLDWVAGVLASRVRRQPRKRPRPRGIRWDRRPRCLVGWPPCLRGWPERRLHSWSPGSWRARSLRRAARRLHSEPMRRSAA